MRYCRLGHPGCLYIGDAQHEASPQLMHGARVREIVHDEISPLWRWASEGLKRDGKLVGGQWIIPIKVRTPASVIAQAIRFDHDVSGNADRILTALTDAGFVISRKADSEPRPDLPETARMFST